MSIAAQIGCFLRELSTRRYSCAGTVDPNSVSDKKNKKSIRIFESEITKNVKGQDDWVRVSKNPRTPATPQTPLEVIQSRCYNWEEWDRHPFYPDLSNNMYAKLLKIATQQQLEHSTWSPENGFSVSHNDLFPRNIMGQIVSVGKVEITGILDWDLTTIAPAVVAFQPPWWLWKYDQYLADDRETFIHREVWEPEHYAATTEQEKQVRAAFEATVGIDVAKHINNPDSHSAKALWGLMQNGIDGNDAYALIDKIVEQWKKWRKQDDDSDSDDSEGESDAESLADVDEGDYENNNKLAEEAS
jgi:hypothetical protein